MKYEVTIGMPVYNAEKYLRNTLDSVLAQTYSKIEFLLVDDCGTDGSLEIVREFKNSHPRGSEIRLLSQPHNMGVSEARNRIIDEAQGQYIYFIDSDDLIEPTTIETLLNAAHEHQAEVVYGSYNQIHTYEEPQREILIRYPKTVMTKPNEMAEFAYLRYGYFQCSVWNVLIDLDFLRRTGLRFIATPYWEDMAFTYDLVTYVSRAVTLPDVTYHYLCRFESLSNYQNRETIRKEEIVRNITTINHLKKRCVELRDKPYISYRCYNLTMNSFYIVCNAIKNKKKITPSLNNRELRSAMNYPLPLADVMRFKKKRILNLILWLIGNLPICLFLPIVWIMGKLKRV